LHFRLVAEPSDTDAETQFRYVLRLKGPGPTSTSECAIIADAIRTVNEKVPADKQYTLALKSGGKHTAIPEDGEVPDDVLDWFFRHMAPYVQAIDRSIKRKTASA
jgi:hypothetical protein